MIKFLIKLVISIVTVSLTLFSCKDTKSEDYVTFSGKITNHLGKDGKVFNKNYEKEIKINKDGTFSDTLHLSNEGALFTFTDGNEYTGMFLKNGNDITLTIDTKEFDETVTFKGKGAVNNNYLAKKSLLSENSFTSSLFDLGEEAFNEKITGISSKFNDLITNTKDLDPAFSVLELEELKSMKGQLTKQYNAMKAEKEKYASFIGKPSPVFTNYENINGSKTSLSDLKGKYVYVDVWATWCGPCKAEIPHLKSLEKEFHGKAIEFVSISVDNGRGYKDNSVEASKEGWKKMIAEKKLEGIQLFADKDWKSDFIVGYGIRSIPRFILIDKEGNVVDANAPRPSSPKIKELFNNLSL